MILMANNIIQIYLLRNEIYLYVGRYVNDDDDVLF